VLLAKSPPSGYAAPSLALVLNLSGDLIRSPYRRLLGVLQMVVNVCASRGFEPGGRAVVTAQKLRLLHEGVRRIARRRLPDFEARYGVPREPRGHAGDDPRLLVSRAPSAGSASASPRRSTCASRSPRRSARGHRLLRALLALLTRVGLGPHATDARERHVHAAISRAIFQGMIDRTWNGEVRFRVPATLADARARRRPFVGGRSPAS